MPRIVKVQRHGRTVTVAFDAGPPLACDRGFGPSRDLAAGQQIDEAILERLRGQAQRHEADAAAQRWLAPHARSRAEIEQRLRRRGAPTDVVADVLAGLEARGLLDDRAYADAWTEERVRRRPRAARLIRSELRARGIDAEISAAATAALDDDALALDLAQRRAVRSTDDWPEFRRRIGAALQRGGFSYSVAERALRRLWEDQTGESSPG